MSETIDQMIGQIIAHESPEYTDIPGDAGGPTKFGISLRFLRQIDKNATEQDIRDMTGDRAAELYRRFFYVQPRIYTLPAELQPMMFDESVNFGAPHAINCLQRAILCLVDGRIDDHTLSVVTMTVGRLGMKAVNNLIVDQFCARYRAIAAENANDEKFLAGWLNRAESWRVA